MVSGSDTHGTPIEVEAIKQGITPKALTDRNHAHVAELFRRWDASFDNYTSTESPVHKEFVQKTLLEIQKNGYIFAQETQMLYCEHDQRFLPDRFVEGKCPYCGCEKARGDQCDMCGKLLEPTALGGAVLRYLQKQTHRENHAALVHRPLKTLRTPNRIPEK